MPLDAPEQISFFEKFAKAESTAALQDLFWEPTDEELAASAAVEIEEGMQIGSDWFQQGATTRRAH